MKAEYSKKNDSKRIILIEDSLKDEEMTVRALRRAGFTELVDVINSGDEALDFFSTFDNPSTPMSNSVPILILLDLTLPMTDGREVLKMLKSSQILKDVPVILLSDPNNDADVDPSFLSSANFCIEKTSAFEQFFSKIREFRNYWSNAENADSEAK